MTDVAIVLGTRPEIIKCSPLLRELERRETPYSLIHTGQHYSDTLDSVFFEQLGLPEPDYNLEVGSGRHGEQTGEMLAGVESILLDESPEAVLVQGDTNTVLAAAIAASKLDTTLGHVEAGLRSFDRDMPEETNRVLTDHCADLLFAPTEESRRLLQEEGIQDDRIVVTGNTVVDAVKEHRELAAEKSTILQDQGLSSEEFLLLTAHRAENVDDPERFRDILAGANRVGDRLEMEVVYPVHPRAENQLDEHEIEIPPRIRLIEPQEYLNFLVLQDEAAIVLTDSGGVQEETCTLGTPCVTLRDNTERPETVEVGSNRLSGTDPDDIVTASMEMHEKEAIWTNPYGDGNAASQILDALKR